jgi:hypothetical protein
MHQGMTLGLDVVPWVPLAKHILTSLAFSAFLAPTVSQYFSLHISSYFLLVSREGIYLSALGLIVRSHVNLLSLRAASFYTKARIWMAPALGSVLRGS